jgi:hypothetical protein
LSSAPPAKKIRSSPPPPDSSGWRSLFVLRTLMTSAPPPPKAVRIGTRLLARLSIRIESGRSRVSMTRSSTASMSTARQTARRRSDGRISSRTRAGGFAHPRPRGTRSRQTGRSPCRCPIHTPLVTPRVSRPGSTTVWVVKSVQLPRCCSLGRDASRSHVAQHPQCPRAASFLLLAI